MQFRFIIFSQVWVIDVNLLPMHSELLRSVSFNDFILLFFFEVFLRSWKFSIWSRSSADILDLLQAWIPGLGFMPLC